MRTCCGEGETLPRWIGGRGTPSGEGPPALTDSYIHRKKRNPLPAVLAHARAQACSGNAVGAMSQGTRAFSSKDFTYTPPGRNHLFVPGPVNMHER